MKRSLTKVEEMLAEAALTETGINEMATDGGPWAADTETLEENLIEVAFAEEGDFADIHEAILREHLKLQELMRPDDCQYGDNEACFT